MRKATFRGNFILDVSKLRVGVTLRYVFFNLLLIKLRKNTFRRPLSVTMRLSKYIVLAKFKFQIL